MAGSQNNMPIRIFGEVHSSKNSRRILMNSRTHKPFVAKSKQSKGDEESFLVQLLGQRAEWERMVAGRPFPLVVYFQFVRRTKGRFDYVNMAQGVADAMKNAGLIPDDSMDYFIPNFDRYRYTVDKHHPGCILTLD